MSTETPLIRVVIGSDDAGFEYKEILKADLEADPRVASVVDVGVSESESLRLFGHVSLVDVLEIGVVLVHVAF